MMTLSSTLDLWDKWNLRGSVILSFSLQVFLTLFASFRKKTTNRLMYYILWLAYLAADSVALFAIGLISHGQCNLSAHVAKVDKAVQAFWASFLLIHLGGPDTLTAFNLEDSSLWNRHLLSYIIQIGVTISLFVQIFLGDRSLLIPTMMVFLAGNIKFLERTLALYLSSLPKLRQSMMTTMVHWHSQENQPLARQLDALVRHAESTVVRPAIEEDAETVMRHAIEEDIKLAESTVVKHAHVFFQIFKVFIVDLIYRSDQREGSREYFNRVSAMDALRVISTELHFFHEMLHTKALAIHSVCSYFFRSIAFTLLTVAFVLFIHLKKHGLSRLDVKITYILLSGGIALDVIALLMLLSSDWTIAKIMPYERPHQRLEKSLGKLLYAMIDNMKKPRFAKCKANGNADLTYNVPNTLFIFRRWSETISACNIFSKYLKESPRNMCSCDQEFRLSNILIFRFRMIGKVVSCFHQARKTIVQTCLTVSKERILVSNVLSMIGNAEYVSKNPFIYNLWIFIFDEVKRKAGDAGDAKDVERMRRICEARGDLFFESLGGEIEDGQFQKYLTGTSYDNSIFVWHIATEICYNIEGIVMDQTLADKREFSKILSDYMLYLLLNQPKVMSDVGNVAQITSLEAITQITSLEAIKEIRNYHLNMRPAVQNVELLCKRMIEHEEALPKSLLRMGIRLARDMERLGERKWEVMSGVWVEMLSYAAVHIRGETHMQVLSQGGELLAFVWLLMLHFGLFHKPEWGIATD